MMPVALLHEAALHRNIREMQAFAERSGAGSARTARPA